MTDFLDAVASFRLYADAIGLALLPFAVGWFAWKVRQRDRQRRGIW